MATHSSILVWEIPWTEEPGRGPHGRVHGLQRRQTQLSMHAENTYIDIDISSIYKSLIYVKYICKL